MESGYDIKTEPFKMSRKRYTVLLVSIFGKGWIITGCLVLSCFVILAICLDYRFYFLSLMWICLIFPLMIAFLYFFHGLKPVNVLNTTEHFLEFKENEVRVTLFLRNKMSNNIETKEKSDEEKLSLREVMLPRFKIYKRMTTGDGVIFFYQGEGKEFLWIPFAAFKNISEYKKIL